MSNLPDSKQLITACTATLPLKFSAVAVNVHSNDPQLLDELAEYYKSYSSDNPIEDCIDLYAIESPIVELDIDWQNVERETGKSGLKEAYFDANEGRWIWKHKTGMKMLQRVEQPIVLGTCRENLAQVINFINNQFLNHYQRKGFMLGHAAAFSDNGQVTAIAASSGGGKSTLMLRFLEKSQNRFLTNDRIMFKRDGSRVSAIGLSKMPRVNPGTLLNSARLNHLLSDAFKVELKAMPIKELWQLEHKFDVQIEDEYGPDRVALEGDLTRLILLDWELNSNEPTRLVPVNLESDPSHIAGLQKRRGPFYHDADGLFPFPDSCDPQSKYVDQLTGVEVYRVEGAVNFQAAVDAYYELLGS